MTNSVSPSSPPQEAPPRPAPDKAAELVALLQLAAPRESPPPETEQLKVAVWSAARAVPWAEPWRWFSEAAELVGFRGVTLERTWSAVRSELLSVGPVILRDAAGWLVLRGDTTGGVEVTRASDGQQRTLSPDAVLRELGGDPERSLTCGVLHALAPAAPVLAPLERPSPTARLRYLVAPEARDLKALVVFAVIVGALNLAIPVTVEALVNTVAFVGLLQPIVVLTLALAACLGFAAVVQALEAFTVELIQRRTFARVAMDLAWRLPRVRHEGLDNAHGPELVNRFFDVATLQKVGAKLLLDGLAVVLSAGVGLLVLAFYHPLLLAFDVFLLAALSFVILVLGRGGQRTAIKESSAKYAVADWLQELVRHPLAFQLAAGREVALDHADTLATTYLERRATHYRVVLRQLLSALALQVVTSALLLGLGGWLVKVGQLSLGQLVASWLIVSIVLAAVAKLGRQLESVYDLLAAVDKLGYLFDLPLELEAGEALPSQEGPARVSLLHVSHAWPGGRCVPREVSAELAPGERVALLGPSGAGKSTLLELLQGLRRCTGGRIDLDGVDLRSLRTAGLRAQVALARSGEVVSGTVAQNLRLGDPSLDLERLRQALEGVGLWDAIQRLPAGLETPLASFGRPLSSRQADLLVLARVLLTRPRLVLLDGILDGLALEAAGKVLEHLQHAVPCTVVVATQRPDVADLCQRVLNLDVEGRLVAQGASS